MICKIPRSLPLAGIASILLLTGCGGHGSDTNDSSSPSRNVTVTLTSQAVQMTEVGVSSFQTAPAVIAVTISNGSGQYYGTVVSDNASIVGNFILTSNQSGNITFRNNGMLPNATGSGNLTFELCSDVNCGDIIQSFPISYSYSNYGLSQPAVTLNATHGGPVQTSQIQVTPVPTAGFFALSTDQAWLTATLNNGVLTVFADPSGFLGPANPQGNVMLTGGGGSLTFTVNFNVS